MTLTGILWAAVSRNDTIIAEAGEDERNGAVVELARKILSKKKTPGWEFESNRKSGLKGIKFHIYEDGEHYVMTQGDQSLLCWSYSVVYDATQLSEDYVRTFLEKMVYMTEPLRQTTEWQTGDVLCAQASFAPILLQKIQQVPNMGKIDSLNKKIDTTRDMMQHNINLMLDRDESLRSLHQKSEELNGLAKVFRKRAKDVRRFRMIQNAKHGMVVGGLIVTATAIVVVPPLVALL